MFRFLIKFVRSRVIRIIERELKPNLAKAINEKIDIPLLSEEQEQELIDKIVDVALDEALKLIRKL